MKEDRVAGADEQPDVNEFTPEDFDAYLPEKWNSNMFTLARRKVKGKLERIGQKLDEALKEGGLSLVMHLSDEFPSLWNKKLVKSQWLFFSRDEAARDELTGLIDKERTLADTLADPTPRFRHVYLGVAVNKDYLEIGLHLHYDAWVDRQNFLSIVRNAESLNELEELIQALPAHYEIGLQGDDAVSPSECGADDISELARAFEENAGGLFIGARLPGDQVPVLGADVLETAREVFQLLIPIYKRVAWSPDNDAISLDDLVAERSRALQATHEELDRERAEREETLKERAEQGLKLREEIEERIRETQAWRQREVAARRAAAMAKAASESKAQDARAEAEKLAQKWGLGRAEKEARGDQVADESVGPNATSAEERSQKGGQSPSVKPEWKRTASSQLGEHSPHQHQIRAPETASADPLEICVGTLVEVQNGFLKGRKGTVQSLDEKGGIKVSFGALSSRLEKHDVVIVPRKAFKEKGRGGSRRNETEKPRRRFRAKLDAKKGSGEKQPLSRTNGETE